MAMTTIVLDVETLGATKEGAEEAVEEMAARRKDCTPEDFVALCPPMARVVCVGLMALEACRSVAYVDGSLFPGHDIPTVNERGVLACTNQALTKADRIVTFNGRGFDLPVLIHRMLASDITPCAKLMSAAREYRYRPNVHIDLVDQFTFFGAGQRYPLRAYALGYGLADPKANGNGAGLPDLIRSGDPEALSSYCLGDVRTEAALYKRWSGSQFDAIRRGIDAAQARAAAARKRLETEGLQAAKEFDAELPPELAEERPLQTMVEAVLGKKPEER